MLCPKCGYELKPTDLNCPRCAKFAAEGTSVAAASAPAPASQAGASPANPVYVEDPYVHAWAKSQVIDADTAVHLVIWMFSVFIGGIAGIIVFFGVGLLEVAMGFTSGMLTVIALICGLPVVFFVSKPLHRILWYRWNHPADSSGKRN